MPKQHFKVDGISFGACLICGEHSKPNGRARCGCFADDLFGPNRDKLNPDDKNAEQPMLRLVERED